MPTKTNTEMLREAIEKSGLSITHISQRMGISRESLYNKINGDTEFKASEIVSFAATLNLCSRERDEIFLDYMVN